MDKYGIFFPKQENFPILYEQILLKGFGKVEALRDIKCHYDGLDELSKSPMTNLRNAPRYS